MPDEEKSSKARQPSTFLFFAAFSALLGAISMGTVLGWNSPAMASMEHNSTGPMVAEDATQTKAWIGSSATLGALAGALASGPIAQKLGRKIALIIYGVPMIAGFAGLWWGANISLIIIGRILVGLSAGLISGTAPTYVVEISTEKIRGMLGTCFQLCVTIGILYVYALGAAVDFRWLSFLCLFPAVGMSLLMLFMPETPFWLMTKSGGDHSKGSDVEIVLKKLRAETNDNESELKDIADQTSEAMNSKGFQMKETKDPLFYKPLVLSVLLMFFQQFSGINAVMFNSKQMLKQAGVKDTDMGAIVIAVAQVIATLIGSQLVDRLGRRILLIGSSVGHSVSLGMLGIYYVAQMDMSWLPILSLVVFIVSFSLGWGPIPWLMIAEITPMQFRSFISAMATAFNWICAFIITHNFETLQKLTSPQFAFFLFTFFCLVSIPFVFLFLPETKGKKFDEILRHFTKGVPANNDSTPTASNAMLNDSEKIELKGVNDNK